MGVTFFSDARPEFFGVFDRSLITMFRITSGKSYTRPHTRPRVYADTYTRPHSL